MANMHLQHMTPEEKKVYNARYYQEHKDYWQKYNKENRLSSDYEKLKYEALKNYKAAKAKSNYLDYLKKRETIVLKNLANKNEQAARALASGKNQASSTGGSGSGSGYTFDDTRTGGLSSKVNNPAVQKGKILNAEEKNRQAYTEALASARKRQSYAVAKNTPVASLPATDAPGYSWYKEVARPYLNQKLVALKYAGSIAIDRAKNLVKSFLNTI